MVTRDIAGSFTIEQLKRQYNLDNKKTIKAIEQNNQTLQRIEADLESYLEAATNEIIETIKSQVDGNTTTWFFDGTPTLENNPAIEWITEEQKTAHIGDLYYDRATGYSYQFLSKLDGDITIYYWNRIQDSDVAKTLAIVNTENDTIDDNKRRIFLDTPTTPYDSGDFWIRDVTFVVDGEERQKQELYICQVTKSNSEEYEEKDFVVSSKFTANTLSEQIGNTLNVLNGAVTTIKQGVDEISQTLDQTMYVEDEEGNRQLINERLSEVSQTIYGFGITISNTTSQLNNLQEDTYTKEQVDTKLSDGSVTKVQTINYTFDENGLSTTKNDANTDIFLGFREVNNKTQEGLSVLDKNANNTELLFAGYDESINESVVRTENLTVRKYFQMGSKSRFEDYTDSHGNTGTGVFMQ